MKSTALWMLSLYVFVLFIILSHSGQVAGNGNSGFISIDCGASRDYTDNVTGFWYQTDKGFIASGTNLELAAGFNYKGNPTMAQQLLTVRSFPEGERNCYTLKPIQENKNKRKYLVRAIFAYGNYDSKNQVPAFDLHLGVNYWDTVQLPNSSFTNIYEIMMQQDSTTNMVQVCLINTGQGTPFISALELRPLKNSLYPAPLPLSLKLRVDIGGSGRLLHNINRYKDDAYDRLWVKYDFENTLVPLETRVEVKAEDSIYELPSEVSCTAMQPMNHSNLLSFNETSTDIFSHYYMFLHFAEIQKLPSGDKRFINVTFYDENSSSQELALEYLKPITLSSKKMTNGIGFTVRATVNSDAPPIINAMEVYQFLPQQNIPTAAQDSITHIVFPHHLFVFNYQ